MQVQTMVTNWLRRDCPSMHRARIKAFSQTVATAAKHRVLNLTELGRERDSRAKEKHSIKQVDRLLGNTHLHGERLHLYQRLAFFAIGHQPRPYLLLDWSGLPSGDYVLRAALSFHGRAFTVFEAVYSQKIMEHAATLNAFLTDLATVLPTGCTPTLVMDAGFRNHWLKAISARGWHWLVRVRHNTQCCLENTENWRDCKTLHAMASARPHRVGAAQLAKTNPLPCTLILYKSPKLRGAQDRKDSSASRTTAVIKARKSALEPWLLATSLGDHSAQDIVNAYRQRMHIEESFRDTKARNGWRMEEMRSRAIERVQILLLIAAYALALLSLIGRYAEQLKYHTQFQANTVRKKRVLSLPRLGHCLLRRKIPLPDFNLGGSTTLDSMVFG